MFNYRINGLLKVLIGLQNFLIAGALYSHTASKIFFIRMFRNSDHLHEHTVIGWATWTALIILCNGIAFLLAVAIPVSYRFLTFFCSCPCRWQSFRYSITLLGLQPHSSQLGSLMEWLEHFGCMIPSGTRVASMGGSGGHSWQVWMWLLSLLVVSNQKLSFLGHD